MASKISVFIAILICSVLLAPSAEAGIGRSAPSETFSKEAYKSMSKEEKKEFRQKVKADFKEMRSKLKAAKKEKRTQRGELGGLEWTGIVVAIGGIAIAIVAGILSLTGVAAVGGLIFLIGAIIFILALIDVI